MLEPCLDLAVTGFAHLGVLFQAHALELGVVRIDHACATADELLAPIAEHGAESVVHLHEDTFAEQSQTDGNRAEDARQDLLPGAQRLLGVLALGDVLEGGPEVPRLRGEDADLEVPAQRLEILLEDLWLARLGNLRVAFEKGRRTGGVRDRCKLTDHRFPREAGLGRKGGIDVEDAVVLRATDGVIDQPMQGHALRHRREGRLKARFRGDLLPLHPFLGRDVFEGSTDAF